MLKTKTHSRCLLEITSGSPPNYAMFPVLTSVETAAMPRSSTLFELLVSGFLGEATRRSFAIFRVSFTSGSLIVIIIIMAIIARAANTHTQAHAARKVGVSSSFNSICSIACSCSCRKCFWPWLV